MKERYTSPVVTVEELTKADVLCVSGGNVDAPTTKTTNVDNALIEGVIANGFDLSDIL